MAASVRLAVKRVRPADDPLPLPQPMTAAAAGLDLMADLEAEVILAPGGRALIPTGLAFEIPPGFEAQIRPRSGMALRHGVTVLNSPGTIDSDYRGEVQVILANLGHEPFAVRRGDRIAQLVVAPVVRAEIYEVESLSPTDRGAGGFGHTGA